MDPWLLTGLALTVVVGLSLGFLGAGGSAITVPVFIYVLGMPAREAIAMSLLVVGSTSLVGATLNARRGVVAWKIGSIFAVFGVVGAYLGSFLTYLVPPAVLLLLYATLILITGALMLARREGDAARLAPHRVPFLPTVASGFAAGLLTGFLGVGGGFLIVPLLVWFGGLDMRDAIGTSLMVIAFNSGAGLAGHLGRAAIDSHFALYLTLCAVTGAAAGAALAHQASRTTLRRAFALLLIGIATFLLIRNSEAIRI
ncbi:MAG: sulfite exporter TauE/SafE family protein [Bryobacteraceae bacterium]